MSFITAMESSLYADRFTMSLAGIALVGLGLLLAWIALSSPRQCEDEPVYVRSKSFPVLGHTLGMMRGSNHYLEKIASVPNPYSTEVL